jgi:hypothetical protein
LAVIDRVEKVFWLHFVNRLSTGAGKNAVKRVVAAIPEASGTIYGIRLMKAVAAQPVEINLFVSTAGPKVNGREEGDAGFHESV